MKTLLTVALVLAPLTLIGATREDIDRAIELRQAAKFQMVRGLICNNLLEPGERASLTVERYKDRDSVSASYRDANGKLH